MKKGALARLKKEEKEHQHVYTRGLGKPPGDADMRNNIVADTSSDSCISLQLSRPYSSGQLHQCLYSHGVHGHVLAASISMP